jgi:hypothetical protein
VALGGFLGAVTGATAGHASAACGTARYSGQPVYGASRHGVAVYDPPRPMYDYSGAYAARRDRSYGRHDGRRYYDDDCCERGYGWERHAWSERRGYGDGGRYYERERWYGDRDHDRYGDRDHHGRWHDDRDGYDRHRDHHARHDGPGGHHDGGWDRRWAEPDYREREPRN